MEKIKLNYIHFCEAAASDSLGRVSILNIFTRFRIPKVPYIYPRFCIVGNFALGKLSGEHNQLEVKIFDPKENLVNTQVPLKAIFPSNLVNQEGMAEINTIFDINNLEINEFGKYQFIISFNDVEMHRLDLIVEQINN